MQNKRVLKWLSGGVILLALMAINLSIFQKERILKQGAIVILQLVPADPRSLMQGDYMALDYTLARQIQQEQECWENDQEPCKPLARNGKVVVKLDAQRRAVSILLYQEQQLQPEELIMKYHVSDKTWRNTWHIGTTSYFFQEGHGERFEAARYGEFRVDSDGTALLTHLLDEQKERIIP